MIPLKSLLRILIVLTIVLVIGIAYDLFFPSDEVLIDEAKDVVEDEQLAIKEEEPYEAKLEKRPEQGISTYIGASIETFQKEFGKPNRMEPSYYDYTWWVYNQNHQYMLVGVLNEKVVTIVAATENIDTTPFNIGENLEDVYQKVSMQPEIEFKNEFGAYRFELFEDDLNMKPMIPLGDIYAQLYFDQFEGNLLFVRFMDEQTLIKHRPYDMAYRGELLEVEPATDEEWELADEATANQIFELTNYVRKKFSSRTLLLDEELQKFSNQKSLRMFEIAMEAEKSEKIDELQVRLDEANIPYESAGKTLPFNILIVLMLSVVD